MSTQLSPWHFRMYLVNRDHHLLRDVSVKAKHSGTAMCLWDGHSELIVWGRMVLGRESELS